MAILRHPPATAVRPDSAVTNSQSAASVWWRVCVCEVQKILRVSASYDLDCRNTSVYYLGFLYLFIYFIYICVYLYVCMYVCMY